MMHLLALSAALAADPAVVTETTTVSQSLDLYAFTIQTCDGVRAEVKDERPADVERSIALIVELRNGGPADCTYQGVVLKGFLDGVYTVANGIEGAQGFTIPAADAVRLRITPFEPGLPRGKVQLQIPPDRGAIILIGVAPDRKSVV